MPIDPSLPTAGSAARLALRRFLGALAFVVGTYAALYAFVWLAWAWFA
ncbi:hypothetical protein [Tsukamurella sputi]|nr:hypothetical protein [Tsukamurella sputi]